MVKVNDSHLFELVKTLNGSEKRYIKLQLKHGAGRKGQNYLLLFDLLTGMGEYDDQKIQQSLAGSKLLVHLSSVQSRLYGLIMKSLRQLQEQKSPSSEIRVLLEEASLLLARNLNVVAGRRLRKAEKIANEHEIFHALPEILSLEQEVALKNKGKDSLILLEAISEKQAQYQRFLNLQDRLHHLHEQTRSLSRHFQLARTRTALQKFEQIMEDPVLLKEPKSKDQDRSHGFLAQAYYLNIYGLYHFALQQMDKANEIYTRALKLWEDHPKWISRKPELYLGIINNFLNSCLYNSEFHADFIRVAKELRKLQNLPENSLLKFQRISFQQELLYYMNFGGDGLPVLIPEIENWLEANENDLAPARILAFQHNITMLSFVRGQSRLSYRWLLKILNAKPGPERQDIRDFARILQAFLQYELGNFDLQEYLLRSAYRYLKRSDRLQKFEQEVVDLIKGLLKFGDAQAEEVQKLLHHFRNQLADLAGLRDGNALLGITELRFWVESKLQGIPLGEYYAARIAEKGH